jgi:hypothetical protein
LIQKQNVVPRRTPGQKARSNLAEFTLKIRRIETWEEEVTVEAATIEAAVAQTNATLVEEGWAHFFGDEDGDYLDCESFVYLPESAEAAVTIGVLRDLIANAPASLPIFPDWHSGPPSDDDPDVQVFGLMLRETGLAVLVGIQYLNEEEEPDEGEEVDDEAGDDMCDICMRSGVAVYRTTLNGDTVCESEDCQAEADRLDAEAEDEDDDDDDDEESINYFVEYSDGSRHGPFSDREDAERAADATDGAVVEVPVAAEDEGEEDEETADAADEEAAVEVEAEEPSHWAEDAKYPVKDWQHEVAEDSTRLSYAEWVADQRDAAADDAEA